MSNESMQSTPLLLTVNEAAKLLGVSARSIWRHIDAKNVEAVSIGKRRLIPRIEIERIAKEGLPSLRLNTEIAA